MRQSPFFNWMLACGAQALAISRTRILRAGGDGAGSMLLPHERGPPTGEGNMETHIPRVHEDEANGGCRCCVQ